MSLKDSALVIVVFVVLWLSVAVPILQSPLGRYPVVDAQWHNLWAQRIASGDLFVYAPYFRAPLYPAVLGLVYFAAGSSVVSGMLLSLVFGVLSLHLVHRIVFERAGRKASLAAASVWMFYGVNLFYCTTLLIVPLYTLLLLSAYYFLDREKPSPAGWLFLGLAAVARPGAVLLFPLALFFYRRGWKKSWLFVVPVFLIWAVNWYHGDLSTIISSQGGINFYIGNGPDADGFTAFAPSGKGTPADSIPYTDNVWAASYAPFEELAKPSEVSSWWAGKTIDYVLDNPLVFFLLTLKKAMYMISPVAIPSNYDVYYMAGYSPVLRILAGTPELPVSGLLLWFLFPGAILAGRWRKQELRVLLWIVFLAAGVLPFFITARFVLPMVPFVVILLIPRVLKNKKKSLLSGFTGIAAGVVFSAVTAGTVASGGVNMAFHDGVAHFQQGEEGQAEVLFLEAVEVALRRGGSVDLNGVDALYNLGIISIRRGDAESAELYWSMAVARGQGYAPAAEALAGLTRQMD
jgi:hypothetical protein